MKQKSLPRRGLTFLKAHALIFALFEGVMALNILVTITHPMNADVISFPAYKMMVIQSLTISLIWAVLFITHLAFHQIRALIAYRAQSAHAEEVEAIQERYEAGTRLDMDTQGVDEDDVIDEDMLETAEAAQFKSMTREK